MAEEAEWELLYWCFMKEDGQNHLVGRGEFVRLIFEEAGVPYKDVGREGRDVIFNYFFEGGNDAEGKYPLYAPPAIRKGNFVLCQTPSICRYLGRKFNLYPKNEEDEAHADQIMEHITDFIAEGRLVFHPVNFQASYHTQEKESIPYVERFAVERIPKYLNYLEKSIKFNNGGNGFFFGEEITYVDLAAFHALDAAQFQFPEGYKTAINSCPALAAFKERIAARPNISAYLKSPRRGFYAGDSMM